MTVEEQALDVPSAEELIENQLATTIIGAAIEVQRCLGPGLMESAYEAALVVELGLRGVGFQRQCVADAMYKGHPIAAAYRIDLIVEDRVLVELKAIERLQPIHHAQLLTYLRLTDKRLGLLINFHAIPLKTGVRRVANLL